MRAVRCCDKQVQVIDVPAPTGEGVKVNVASAGICGSDLHMVKAGYPIPGTLGHEVAGTLADGRAVALEPLAPCGHCDMCVQGDYGLCRLGAGMVHGIGLEGGMADQIAEQPQLSTVATMHAVTSINNPNKDAQLAVLNEGIRDVRESGAWFEIVQRHLVEHSKRTASN